MLRYHNRPPRRPRLKTEAKVATRRSPKWWPVRLNATQDVFMTLIAALTLVSLCRWPSQIRRPSLCRGIWCS